MSEKVIFQEKRDRRKPEMGYSIKKKPKQTECRHSKQLYKRNKINLNVQKQFIFNIETTKRYLTKVVQSCSQPISFGDKQMYMYMYINIHTQVYIKSKT